MNQVNAEDLAQVKQWALGALERMERQKKSQAMMTLMMEAMNRVSQPAIKKIVAGPTKASQESLTALEKTNAEFPAKMQAAIDKMETALVEERRKTELLRAWLKELEG